MILWRKGESRGKNDGRSLSRGGTNFRPASKQGYYRKRSQSNFNKEEKDGKTQYHQARYVKEENLKTSMEALRKELKNDMAQEVKNQTAAIEKMLAHRVQFADVDDGYCNE